jgi:hypothetical protein
MVYFKFQIVFRQEREELRALRREIKVLKAGKVKRKVCVWKRKKEKPKSKKIYERKREEEWQEGYERDESSERKKIKSKEKCHVVERQNFHSFFNHVQSDNEDVIGAS